MKTPSIRIPLDKVPYHSSRHLDHLLQRVNIGIHEHDPLYRAHLMELRAKLHAAPSVLTLPLSAAYALRDMLGCYPREYADYADNLHRDVCNRIAASVKQWTERVNRY